MELNDVTLSTSQATKSEYQSEFSGVPEMGTKYKTVDL